MHLCITRLSTCRIQPTPRSNHLSLNDDQNHLADLCQPSCQTLRCALRAAAVADAAPPHLPSCNSLPRSPCLPISPSAGTSPARPAGSAVPCRREPQSLQKRLATYPLGCCSSPSLLPGPASELDSYSTILLRRVVPNRRLWDELQKRGLFHLFASKL